MRITGGILRGRRLLVPRTLLRPTQDRVREALFNILTPGLTGARFLDLFSGSGAVGFEAGSRGAEVVWLVEQDRRAAQVVRENIAELKADWAHLVQADVLRFLKRAWTEPPFDVIYCDPPYSAGRGAQDGVSLVQRVVYAVAEGDWLANGGVMVVEQETREPLTAPSGWAVVDERDYGKTRLRFLREDIE
jgi:16S rRNA (guanine966-N2)-methyltransferase